MHYMVNEIAFSYVFSQKLIDIIDKFNVPPHNRIPVRIDGFETQYYLIGFPIIRLSEYDFDKSLFYDYDVCKEKRVIYK